MKTNMSRKMIIGIIIPISIIILIIIIVLAFSGTGFFSNEVKYEDLTIKIDKEDIRVGEVFNVSIDEIHESANITWIFGDGNISYGISCNHLYTISEHYRIEVNATWEGGRGGSHIEIPVFNKDETRSRSGGSLRYVNILGGIGPYTTVDLLPSITQPRIDTSIRVDNSIGKFEIQILIEDYEEGTQRIIYQEEHTETMSTITFSKTFSDDDIPLLNKTYGFIIGFMVRQGRCGSWEEEIAVYY